MTLKSVLKISIVSFILAYLSVQYLPAALFWIVGFIGLLAAIYLGALITLLSQLKDYDSVIAERLVQKWNTDETRVNLQRNLTGAFIAFVVFTLITGLQIVTVFLAYVNLVLVLKNVAHIQEHYTVLFEEFLEGMEDD